MSKSENTDMIKRTLYFGNPAYLSMNLRQLVIRLPEEKHGENKKEIPPRTIPIEDIGLIVLDHRQITVTQALLAELLDNNCAIITCSDNHMPAGLMLPLYGNTIQNERFRFQLDASIPLKKQLWQQTIQAKIANQTAILKYATGEVHKNMIAWSKDVKSGDSGNMEARAAAYYWKTVFNNKDFIRGRFEGGLNDLLNYGYSIVRAVIARALVGSGLLPTLGIHHHNRYNAYCLADDIMEPYRPYIDKLVIDLSDELDDLELTTYVKTKFLSIPVMDVIINGRRSPLSVAATYTTASLVKCFTGEARKILYPEIPFDHE